MSTKEQTQFSRHLLITLLPARHSPSCYIEAEAGCIQTATNPVEEVREELSDKCTYAYLPPLLHPSLSYSFLSSCPLLFV